MSQPFRDPVHNFIRLRDDEVGLVATPLFQRLRRIRQLAMANLVYPGAVHTRFEHSLGVCHVAGMLAEQLGLQQQEVELVRLAALLHDVGHGPFSHVSEDLLDWYADRSGLPAHQKREKIHELVTARFIGTDPDVAHILGGERCDQVVQLLADGLGQPALRAIVSGPLDADKQDYLLRDSYFCGVPYGVFDIYQLHRSLVLFGPDHEKELMIDADGVHAVEQYVLAKYYLASNVYRHRVRLITDQMIVRAIRLGIDEEENTDLRSLYSFNDSSQFFDNYRSWDDARFLTVFGTDDDTTSPFQQLISRLRNRNLLKRVFSCTLLDIESEELRELLTRIEDAENAQSRASLERKIANEIGTTLGSSIDARYVIIHVYTIKSVRVSSRNDEASIMVAHSPEPRRFEDESALFASISEGYSEGYVDVYAPVSWRTPTERKKTREKLRSVILECMQSHMQPEAKEETG